MQLQERTATELRRAIMEGVFQPGQRLSEVDLAQRFQTSRSPIREALVQLELEGFVARADTGRVYVRPLSLTEAEQLFIVRANLEGLACRLAVDNVNRKDVLRLEANIDGMEQASRKRDFHAALGLGAEFHRTIIDACGNAPLEDCLRSFRARTARYRFIVAALEEFNEKRVNEHRAILSAIRAQDPELAELAMRSHIVASSRETLAALRSFLARSEEASGR
ncbi:MAG: GntR family transcriptional regulator [Alphaproteobacteria bacterium]|nr:GntR family transcriptional regulator [Alphaproteobacteria bacterium]